MSQPEKRVFVRTRYRCTAAARTCTCIYCRRERMVCDASWVRITAFLARFIDGRTIEDAGKGPRGGHGRALVRSKRNVEMERHRIARVSGAKSTDPARKHDEQRLGRLAMVRARTDQAEATCAADSAGGGSRAGEATAGAEKTRLRTRLWPELCMKRVHRDLWASRKKRGLLCKRSGGAGYPSTRRALAAVCPSASLPVTRPRRPKHCPAPRPSSSTST